MKVTQVKGLDAGHRVQGFLDTHANGVGIVVPAPLRAKLDTVVAYIVAYRSEQSATDEAAKRETARQDGLRTDLFDRFLKPITRIARLAQRDTPEFPALGIPVTALRKSDFQQQATTLIDAAANVHQTFVNHGLPADFAAQAKAIIGQIESSLDARARYRSRRFAATQALIANDAALRDTIGVLDGVIVPVLQNDPASLGDWIASKRIHQAVSTPLPGGDTSDGNTTTTDGTQPDSPAAPTLSNAEPIKSGDVNPLS